MVPLYPLVAFLVLLQFSVHATDGLVLKNRERISCEIVSADPQHLFIRLQSPTDVQTPLLSWPREDVASIEFGTNVGRDTFISAATKEQFEAVSELWRQFSAILEVPGSPSASIGLRYGLLLLEHDSIESKTDALAVFSKIAQYAGELKDRESAQQGTLRSLVALGYKGEARADAERIISSRCGAPLKAEARLVLAAAKEQMLRELVQDNPRWQEDESVRGERDALYNETLDLYLFPSLLPDVPPELRLRALWGAFSLQREARAMGAAENTAIDVVTFFPKSVLAEKARSFLVSRPPEFPKPKPTNPTQHAQNQSAQTDYATFNEASPRKEGEQESSTSPASSSTRRKRGRH